MKKDRKKSKVEEKVEKTSPNTAQKNKVDNKENIEEKISKEEALQKELQNEKEKYLRLYAEFENYRKRTAKEKLELFETAGEKVISNLLPVLDDFERAIAEMTKNKEDDMAKGVQLIFDKMLSTLHKEGLKVVEVKQGDDFDPEIHEAIAQIPAPNKELKNKIIDVVEKGYQLGNKIIRFPKVVTGK